LSPAKRRAAVEHVRQMLGPDRVSQRRACKVLGQTRSTQRRKPAAPDDEPRLVARMVALATQYGRYGYRRVTALLRAEGWRINAKRVERLWRREGLKVPSAGARGVWRGAGGLRAVRGPPPADGGGGHCRANIIPGSVRGGGSPG
jgi:hypothetical protein